MKSYVKVSVNSTGHLRPRFRYRPWKQGFFFPTDISYHRNLPGNRFFESLLTLRNVVLHGADSKLCVFGKLQGGDFARMHLVEQNHETKTSGRTSDSP